MENYLIKDNTLYINEGVEIILSESFAERSDFEILVLPNSVQEIGGAAFAGCENLKEVRFQNTSKLVSIDDGAFTVCNNLVHFDFPDSLKTIGEMAFYQTGLSEIHLKENVERVEDSAFWNMEELKEINIDNPNCKIGKDVISECAKLKKGYIACGYPNAVDYNHVDELIYTLLWLSCPERHDEKTSSRAKRFIQNNEMLIMEKVLNNNNVVAMNGLMKERLLNDCLVEKYILEATKKELLEITNLLLECKRDKNKEMNFEEFEL